MSHLGSSEAYMTADQVGPLCFSTELPKANSATIAIKGANQGGRSTLFLNRVHLPRH